MATAIHSDTNSHHTGGASDHRLAHLWHEMSDTMRQWQERAIERRELADLDEHMLQDIGLTRAEVNRELDKPFWRA